MKQIVERIPDLGYHSGFQTFGHFWGYTIAERNKHLQVVVHSIVVFAVCGSS